MKNLLLTGGSRGLGLEIAKKFLSNGWKVYNISRTKPPIEHENLYHKNKTANSEENFTLKLSILNFVYYLRDKYLGDDTFDDVNVDELLDLRFLSKQFNLFKKLKISLINKDLDETLNSTSHFTLVDKYQNVISLPSCSTRVKGIVHHFFLSLKSRTYFG